MLYKCAITITIAITPMGWVAMLAEEELFPPDPEPLDHGVPELDIIEGLSLRMTQAMNHYQCEECCCFVCGATDHFTQDCLHQEVFCIWHKEHLNFQGACPKKPLAEVSTCVATTCCASSMITSGPTVHWIGSETLLSLWVEGLFRQVKESCSSDLLR